MLPVAGISMWCRRLAARAALMMITGRRVVELRPRLVRVMAARLAGPAADAALSDANDNAHLHPSIKHSASKL